MPARPPLPPEAETAPVAVGERRAPAEQAALGRSVLVFLLQLLAAFAIGAIVLAIVAVIVTEVNPELGITRLSFRLCWRDVRLKVDVTSRQARYTVVEGDSIDLAHHGTPFTVTSARTVIHRIPPAPELEAPRQPAGVETAVTVSPRQTAGHRRTVSALSGG